MSRAVLAALAAACLCEAPAFEKIALVDDMDFSFVYDIEKPGGCRQVFEYVQTLEPTAQFWRAQAGGLLRYPSKAEYDGYPCVEVPIDKRRIPANFLTTGWLKTDDRNFDGMAEAVGCCREKGVKFGIHWSTEESHGATWCLGPWYLAHPECWCRCDGGAPWPGRTSLAFPEVLEHKMAIARELNAYAPAFVYLDFYRAYGAEPMWEYVRPVMDAWRARYDEEPPKDWKDPRWVRLVSEFNHRFVRELHKTMPKSELILAVDRISATDDFLRVNRAVNWRELVAEGAVDAIGVMCVRPDWSDPWTSTRRIYEEVVRTCRGKAKVYFPVNAYSGSIRHGIYEYAKRLGITPEEATRKLLELAAETGADGVTLECVDYGNYTPGVAKVIREFQP